jgi:hypothetical protein
MRRSTVLSLLLQFVFLGFKTLLNIPELRRTPSGGNFIKLFSTSLTTWTSKLEHLFLTSLYSLV